MCERGEKKRGKSETISFAPEKILEGGPSRRFGDEAPLSLSPFRFFFLLRHVTAPQGDS